MSKLSSHLINKINPPDGASTARQRPRHKRLRFPRGTPPTTAGQLLLEVARFAADNMVFAESGDTATADRVRDHLLQIRELAGRRLAELALSSDELTEKEPLVEH